MQSMLIIAVSFHVLAGVFWAGSTFVLARQAGKGIGQLIFPQIGAGTVAFVTGGYLWSQLHAGSFEAPEKILAAGVGCAAIALIVQMLLAASQRRAATDPHAEGRAAAGERLAALMLAITVICMATARYA